MSREFYAHTIAEADKFRREAYPGDRIVHVRQGGTYVEVVREVQEPANRQQRKAKMLANAYEAQANHPQASRVSRKQRRAIVADKEVRAKLKSFDREIAQEQQAAKPEEQEQA